VIGLVGLVIGLSVSAKPAEARPQEARVDVAREPDFDSARLAASVRAPSATGQAAAPAIGAEKVVRATAGFESFVDMAFDGTNYLVVWDVLVTGTWDVWGARIRASDGKVLDPNGIPISVGGANQQNPAIGYDGSEFLVVWEDDRYNTQSNHRGSDIVGAIVLRDGTVRDTTPATFSSAVGDQKNPALAPDDTGDFLVVWDDRRFGETDPDIFSTLWTRAAGVISPQGVSLNGSAKPQEYPDVVYFGTDFLVVWQDQRNSASDDVYGAVVRKNGVVRDTIPAPLAVADGIQVLPRLAFDGSVVLLVWEDGRNGSNYDIYGARWSPTDGLLDASGFVISNAAGPQQFPEVAPGGPFLVLWCDPRNGNLDLYGARVTAAGVVKDPTGFPVSARPGSEGYSAVVPAKNGGWAIAYERDFDAFFTTVSAK
jgi:hypothetical protein